MKIWKQPKKYSTPHYDSSNIAITYNSPYLCKECYIKKYGENK